MKTLTDKEAMEWCKQWPLQLEFSDAGLLCGPTGGHTYRVDVSKMPWRDLLSTARALAHLGCHSVEAFPGGLVWIRRTRIAVPEMVARDDLHFRMLLQPLRQLVGRALRQQVRYG
jgi:hypothetical protein